MLFEVKKKEEFDVIDEIGQILIEYGPEVGLTIEWRYSTIDEFMETADKHKLYPEYKGDFTHFTKTAAITNNYKQQEF